MITEQIPFIDDSECDVVESKTIIVCSLEITDSSGRLGRYTGSVERKSRLPHGNGCMEYPELIYNGQWVKGDWCGYGSLTFKPCGDVYEGGFFDNMKHGVGVMKYADGKVYDGTFQCDRMGKGTMKYVDGSSYWGYWCKDGKRHGRGKFISADGTVYDGEFNKGIMEGHGRLTWPCGKWYLGEFSQGKPNGLGMQVSAEGELLHEGAFSSGKPVTCSSFQPKRLSNGDVLLYPSSCGRRGSLVGPLPRQVLLRKKIHMKFSRILFFE